MEPGTGYWEEWKYLHSYYWGAAFKWSLLFFAVLFSGFANPALFVPAEWLILGTPVVAGAIAMAAGLHLNGEWSKVEDVWKAYNKDLRARPQWSSDPTEMGSVVPALFFWGGPVLAAVAAYLLGEVVVTLPGSATDAALIPYFEAFLVAVPVLFFAVGGALWKFGPRDKARSPATHLAGQELKEREVAP